MTPHEIIKWLRECSKEGQHNCKECPYNKEPYEAGCGKLLSDAALLLSVFFPLPTSVVEEIPGHEPGKREVIE